MVIAVDFDGTIVEHKYPRIGEEISGAVSALKHLKKAGHSIILWTCRTDRQLDEAVRWLNDRGFIPDAANKNVLQTMDTAWPKIFAEMYIDDKNFGGFPGWVRILNRFKLSPECGMAGDMCDSGKKAELYYKIGKMNLCAECVQGEMDEGLVESDFEAIGEEVFD